MVRFGLLMEKEVFFFESDRAAGATVAGAETDCITTSCWLVLLFFLLLLL